ncbi:hypothetical protein OAV20_00905 [Euryarchaeota archaeon]|nr:hypothetical protein [Euryarchaeota archaeon]
MSYIGAPASAQEVVEDPKQPTVDNPHMHIYGTDDFSSCFSHFDGEDATGSAEEGKGMRTWGSGQQVDVDFMCSMNEGFREDLYLDENGTIELKMTFNIYSADCNDNADCTNLTLSLKKGTLTVATQEFPEMNNDGNDQTINWNIDVDRNMTRWNKSGSEEPVIQIEFSKPGISGIGCGLFLDCDGEFSIYYSNQNDSAVEVLFPVINKTKPVDDADDGIGGAVSDALPGFGLMAGMSALAMAAVASSRINKKQ